MDDWAATQPRPPVRPRHTGRVLLIVLGTMLGVCCIASTTAAVVRGALHGATGPANPGGPGVPGAAPPGLGDAVRDGQFEFVVHGGRRGRQRQR